MFDKAQILQYQYVVNLFEEITGEFYQLLSASYPATFHIFFNVLNTQFKWFSIETTVLRTWFYISSVY